MMKLLPLALLPLAAFASPFEPGFVPKDSPAFIHLDSEAAAGSSFIATAVKTPAVVENLSRLEQQFDFNATRDTRGVTIISFSTEKKPTFSVVINGKFNLARFNEKVAANGGVKAEKLGDHTYYKVSEVFAAKTTAKPNEAVLCFLDDTHLILAPNLPDLSLILATADKKVPAFSFAEEDKGVVAKGAIIVSFLNSSFFSGGTRLNAKGERVADTSVKSCALSAVERDGSLNVTGRAVCADAMTAKSYLAMLTEKQLQLVNELEREDPLIPASRKLARRNAAELAKALEINTASQSLLLSWRFKTSELLSVLESTGAALPK